MRLTKARLKRLAARLPNRPNPEPAPSDAAIQLRRIVAAMRREWWDELDYKEKCVLMELENLSRNATGEAARDQLETLCSMLVAS